MKDKILTISRRYPLLTAALLVAVLAGCILLLTQEEEKTEEVVAEDVAVTDTLSLNILCIPVMECLPLYHAIESGICDSIELPLSIYDAASQFDIDSIMRRTKRIDCAVFDTYRMDHYTSQKKKLAVTPLFPLQGQWKLISSGQLRIREVDNLKKRTLALDRFSTSTHEAENALKTSKLTTTSLYLAQINDFGIRCDMLDEAQVEAVILPEPYASTALVRGHRCIWQNDSVSSLILCARDKSMKSKVKSEQIKKLKQAYNMAVTDLNRNGVHAADSCLLKRYHLSQQVVDTLHLPKYKLAR